MFPKGDLAAGFLAMISLVLLPASGRGQTGPLRGVILGSLTADRISPSAPRVGFMNEGSLRAVRIQANDTVHKITYSVFSKDGIYRINNLPTGTYEVRALQPGFESNTQIIELKAGDVKSADLVLKFKELKHTDDLVDMDTLYPPGPARDLLMKDCLGCHSFEHTPLHKMASRDKQAWSNAINNMFVGLPPRGVPIVSAGAVSVAEREQIAQYFATNFGEGSKRRDLKLDQLPMDENVLSRAMYVQYDLPPAGKDANGRQITHRGMHDVFPSQVSSKIWVVDTNTGSILGMDPSVTDYRERSSEWLLKGPTSVSVHPHGIIESNGHVFWTEIDNSAVGELDPMTGAIHEYLTPTRSGPHTPRADTKGNIWFSELSDASKIGMLDVRTKQITEWDPSPEDKNAHYYGLVVDKRDRVWAAGMTSHTIVGYDPRIEKWAVYRTPTQYSGPRRVTIAPNGMVWFSENIGDAIGMLNPETGKITEYKSPFKYGGEYECYSDAQGNIWISLRAYNTLVRFEPKSERYTYFPYPVIGGFVPKVETDNLGSIWFGIGATLTSLNPDGNIPR